MDSSHSSLQALTRQDQLKLKQALKTCDQEEHENDKGDGEIAESEQLKGQNQQPNKTTGQPKAKAQGKAKAKAGSKAKAKAAVKKTPKRKAAPRKAKSIPSADGNGEDCEESAFVPEGVRNSEDEGPDDDMPTPKKVLFQDDADGNADKAASSSGDNNAAMEKAFVDPKTGETMTLKQLFDNYAPTTYLKNKPPKKEPEAKTEVKGTKRKAGSPKAKAKARGKAKAKASPKAKAKASLASGSNQKSPMKVTSPSIKKEQKRRKKKQAEVTQTTGQDLEDKLIRSIFVKHIEDCDGMETDDVKTVLKGAFPSSNKLANLSSYWTKTDQGAVGVMTKKGATWTYFSYKHNVKWHVNMALAYCSAGLLVTCTVLRIYAFLF